MATKAGRKDSPNDEIWFSGAVALLADKLTGDADVAERLLKRSLAAGDVPYSYLCADGIRVRGESAVWNNLFLTVDWAANRAFISAPIAPRASDPPLDVPVRMDGIKVNRAAVEALFGAGSTESESESPAKRPLEPQGWQAKRVLRFLHKRFPPEGKTPRKTTYKELIAEFAADPNVVKENQKRSRANPSQEVMAACRNYLGYVD